ncbi:ubiquitin-protein ligase-like protein Sel1/Ubx2 [Amylocarpus encephaloides]|uniref:Ubiquitin-protein ligase-like protein Sel1/Ubx2 n=1 Tax=Amylocarpus encephaloides TaxID=45428 RepID=A0A9P7YN01_9HELO|nr:ubiquitin-protein ligase-like protein Sel1/Ubx2 [Amylocarpus encephaloides]
MKRVGGWWAPFAILFLQILWPLVNANHVDDKLQSVLDASSRIAEESSSLSSLRAAQSGTPHQPIREAEKILRTTDGTQQVEKALTFLRRYERLNPRPSRKPSGLVATVGQYVWAILPKLSAQGPTSSGSGETRHKALPKPVAEAVQLLEEAAQVNNSDAMFLLAQINFYGNYTHPKDHAEAFRRYHQLASFNGNASAQHMVGFMYATGIGGAVERDQAKALLYHTFAANGGHVRSEMTVAHRHHYGIGTPRNCEVTVKHYKNVADRAIEWFRSGPPGGMAWVPDSYRLADDDGGVYGEGASFSSAGDNANKAGPSSDAHAALDDVLEYLDLMSRKGDFKATFSLGRIHYDGQKGLARNMKSAKWYFMRVAKLYWTKDGRIIDSDKPGLEKIASKAAGYLGRMFLRGEGVKQSFDKAHIWFQRGIKGGDAGSLHGSGLMYLNGLGVPKNIPMATEKFKSAADQDYAPAMVALGALYLDQGTAGDLQVANRYFELAARYGHIESLYYLAEIINQGLGRDRSCGLATAYYKNVAEKAEPFLSSFAEANREHDEGDIELALLGYMFAAEQGYEKGQANVAYLLDQQKSKWDLPSWLVMRTPQPQFLQNTVLALIYWTRSAKQSNIDSMVKMGDYYLYGIGTQMDMEKAASCYTAASEFHQSAQALFNLGWMHENGVGLDQDFHLAKRYYDHALETNDEAFLPATLSLYKLRLRSAWNTFTHGRVNSIQDEPAPKKQWSLSEWISNFLQDDHPYYGDSDYDDTNFLSETDHLPGGDSDGLYDDIIDDGMIEALIIIGLVAALVFLIYYRQQHQLTHRRGEATARVEAGDQPAAEGPPQQQQEDRGVFPQPGEPEFGQWVAGGVGH